jgi:pimeloyl-ACP methyl ester carboxylesterase
MTMTRNLAVWLVALTVAGLMMAFALAGAAKAQDATGEWHGTLTAPGGSLRVAVTITAKAGGGLEGGLQSPDQGPQTYRLEAISAEDGRLTFDVPILHGAYGGRWDAAQSAWVGQWSQGAPLLLTLVKGPLPPPNRPQTPKAPFPYAAEEVSFDSAPGVRLAGTLTRPAGKGPFPAVVMITGSGAQDRDEAIAGHRPFWVIADALARRGVAVLRWDDRGFAKSTGDFAKATSEDFAADGLAAMAYLRARHDIDPRRIGVIGHSEGGMVGPMMAAADPRVAFVVMLAGPGVPTRELMAAQRDAVSRAMGLSPDVIARNGVLQAQVEKAMAEAKDWDAAKAAALKVMTEAGLPTDAAGAQISAMGSVWYKWFIAYDPRPNLAKLRMPVLALDGDKDVQVVSKQNLPAIREALKANRDATVIELPGLNHLFQTAGTGGPAEYGKIEETISPSALNLMTDWIIQHTARGAAR